MRSRTILLLVSLAFSATSSPTCSTGAQYNVLGAHGGCNANSACTQGAECFSKVCGASVPPNGTTGVWFNCTRYNGCSGNSLAAGWQTGPNCGGDCAQCGPTGACLSGADCDNSICTFPAPGPFVTTYIKEPTFGGRCTRLSTCSDGEQNGGETDVDCGVAACCTAYKLVKLCPALCGLGQSCSDGGDCSSQICRTHEFEDKSFCVLSDLTSARPDLPIRVRSGLRLYDVRPATLNLAGTLAAAAALIDVPREQIQVEVVAPDYRAREYGNVSYLDVRAEKAVSGKGFNMTLSDTISSTRVRFVCYVGDHEGTLMLSRLHQILSARLLPGGWATENHVQERLYALASDAEYCDWFGRNYTAPAFNMSTGVDCSGVLNCTTTALFGRVDTGNWNYIRSDGAHVSSRFLYNETSNVTLATVCASHTPDPSMTVDADRALAEENATMTSFYQLSPLSGLGEIPDDVISAALNAWIRTRCLPLWRAAEDGALPLAAALSADPLAAERCPVRKVVGTARTVLFPARVGVNTTWDARILNGVARFNINDYLEVYGVAFNKTRGAEYLAPGASFDSSFGGRAPSGNPSDNRLPKGFVFSVEPRGTPLSPLIRDQDVALQPVALLVDRHNRQVLQWKGVLTAVLTIDPTIWPSEWFFYGSPLPSPTPRLFMTYFEEPSVAQQRLYPDNVFTELVSRPLAISGALTAVLDKATGYARFQSLSFSRAVPRLQLNISTMFTSVQLNLRSKISGATRMFAVHPPPPAPLILETREKLSPYVIGFLIVLALGAFIVLIVCGPRYMRRARQTRRSDMRTEAPDPEDAHDGEKMIRGADGSVSFFPFYDGSLWIRFFAEPVEPGDKPKMASREKRFADLRDYTPARYRFGVFPGSFFEALAWARGQRTDRRNDLEPTAEHIRMTQQVRLREQEKHKLGADDLPSVGPAALKALGRIEDGLHSGHSKIVHGDKKARKALLERREAEKTHVEESRSELDGRLRAVLGDKLLTREPEELALEAEVAAAAAAKAAERARKEGETLSLRVGGHEVTLPVGKYKTRLADKLASARVVLNTGTTPAAGGGSALVVERAGSARLTGDLPPSPTRKFAAAAVKPKSTFNDIMLRLHARITPPMAHLDPVTKLPKISRNLNADDEPPADTAQQTARALEEWTASNKARIQNMQANITNASTRTLTRARAAASESKRHIPLPTEVVESTETVVPSPTPRVPGAVVEHSMHS